VDYGTDKAYIGDDKGHLVRLKDVFCTINVACTGAAPPAPSIDTIWGTAGTVTVACGSKLTGPVVDFFTGNVFVGCSDGKLYGFNSSGTSLANSPVTVGNGAATGGIVDPPIVDGANGFVYAVSGTDGANAILVQTKTNLTSRLVATLGKAGGQNLHAGAFNDAYFSSANSAAWLLYVCGYNGGGTQSFLFGVGFAASRSIIAGTPANSLNFAGVGVAECSPFTEILNSGTDRLFLSFLSGTLDGFNINAFPTGTFATAPETGGTSGMIVDNVGSQGQASSIYFTTLGGSHSAVKLTQSALQ